MAVSAGHDHVSPRCTHTRTKDTTCSEASQYFLTHRPNSFPSGRPPPAKLNTTLTLLCPFGRHITRQGQHSKQRTVSHEKTRRQTRIRTKSRREQGSFPNGPRNLTLYSLQWPETPQANGLAAGPNVAQCPTRTPPGTPSTNASKSTPELEGLDPTPLTKADDSLDHTRPRKPRSSPRWDCPARLVYKQETRRRPRRDLQVPYEKKDEGSEPILRPSCKGYSQARFAH